MDGQRGQLRLPVVGWSALRIPLELTPGDHKVKLWVQQAVTGTTLHGGPLGLRLGVGRFTLHRRDARNLPSEGEREAPAN
jgi:hypothetical protein